MTTQKLKTVAIEKAREELKADYDLQVAVYNGQRAYQYLVNYRADQAAEIALKKQHDRIQRITAVSGKPCKAAQKPKSFFRRAYMVNMFNKYHIYQMLLLNEKGYTVTMA